MDTEIIGIWCIDVNLAFLLVTRGDLIWGKELAKLRGLKMMEQTNSNRRAKSRAAIPAGGRVISTVVVADVVVADRYVGKARVAL